MHRLSATQLIPRPIDEVFDFFSRPRNLSRLTPSSMGFEFLTDDVEMRAGLEIAYRIRPLFGIPVGWLTRITEFDAPNGFRDVQLRGPYRRWEHAHRFEPVAGGTLVHDDVDYDLPGGPAGNVLNPFVIRNELRWIFLYRSWAIRAALAEAGPASGRTVAVAGGTGFVGGAIAAELRRRGDRVIVLSHEGEDARGPLPDDVEIRTADARTGEGLVEALRGVDALAIALAFKNLPMESPSRHQTFAEVDAGGTEQLVRAAREAGVGRLIYISGAGAAPDAERHWYRAKWRAETAVRGSGLAWTIIRPTWIFGARDVSLNRFIGFARRLPAVPLTNLGNQRLAPVYVDDAAVLAADSLDHDAAVGQVFELGGPATYRMRDIIGTALRVAGLRKPIVPGPTPLLKLGAWPLRFLPSPPLTPDAIDFINQPATVDLAPLLQRMPRRLTPLEEGLRAYLAPGDDLSLSFDGADVREVRLSPR
jgi:NADH dehydrogenase